MFDNYANLFTENALKAGYTQQNIDDCLAYAKPIIEKGLPVIYNTSHLAGLVGYKKDYIKKAVQNTNYYYRRFKVKKRNGKEREISEPLPSLKEIQLWVLKEILENVKVSTFAKAYRPKIGITENLKFHVNRKLILNLDVKDFFPSIKQNHIEEIFKNLGYSKLISNLLSKLCTLNGSLPQGAPTSPYLSNLYFKPIDITISEFCKERSIRYTRYADDLTFSGDFDSKELTDYVQLEIASSGFVLNLDKSKLLKKGMRQTVTAVVVNEKPQVVFYKRNKLRQTIYYIKKFGLDNHAEHEKINHKNYIDHLLGKVNFVLQINPTDKEFIEYRTFLRSLKLMV